ncbi:hypothetical protein D030_4264B, partial [Vibrio parahaemolyticus AQ3810]
ESKVTLRP